MRLENLDNYIVKQYNFETDELPKFGSVFGFGTDKVYWAILIRNINMTEFFIEGPIVFKLDCVSGHYEDSSRIYLEKYSYNTNPLWTIERSFQKFKRKTRLKFLE